MVDIRRIADFAALLPASLPGSFTTADMATAASIPRRLAQQMAYCLKHAGVIAPTGKTGNAVEYIRISA